MEAGAEAGAERAAEQGGIEVFSDEEAWDVLEEIPNDSAAALILLEHHWAVPLRDAIARAGGFRITDGFISPLDLVAIGLVTAEEAKELHARRRDRSGDRAEALADRPKRRHEMLGRDAEWHGGRRGESPGAASSSYPARPASAQAGAGRARFVVRRRGRAQARRGGSETMSTMKIERPRVDERRAKSPRQETGSSEGGS